jgi:hypothetical protein
MSEGRRITDRRYGAAVDPPYLYPDYVGTRLRAPKDPLVVLPHTLTELTAPVFGESALLATCNLYTSPSPRDRSLSRFPSSA